MHVAYYDASIAEFLVTDHRIVMAELVQSHGFSLEQEQRIAWSVQIEFLQAALPYVSAGHLWFEFIIPRMGKRADVVLLIDGVVYVLEFKVGAPRFDRAAIEQVHDYALDLKNFHKGSHHLSIIPVLIATSARYVGPIRLAFAHDGVAKPVLINSSRVLNELIGENYSVGEGRQINQKEWMRSGYMPTPTIVEAAQALYSTHEVTNVARSDASAKNLSQTSDCLHQIIDHSKRLHRKSICFVTGVPGAGKTLAGLNVATQRAHDLNNAHAVFLSGNGPLVEVLREALARDEVERIGTTITEARRKVSSFIQNIHHFRNSLLDCSITPIERVVVFDEAQRAWNCEQTSRFMRERFGIVDFNMSEPEFLVSAMDRHSDWCVIVCLIGGGQEINTGEAGLDEWLSALQNRFSHWDIYISEQLREGDYVSSETTLSLLDRLDVIRRHQLHLSVSMRSFRAEALSSFIYQMLENDPHAACSVLSHISARYPVKLTRDLNVARTWLRNKARGSERIGLVASSGAYRLRADGIHVKAKINAPNWFLNARDDVRSSFYLEEVATEFDVQGLELDWVGVCWDADLRHENGNWACYRFRGTRWQNINQVEGRQFLKNAYRVALTRARQGMIIFVPRGDSADHTRCPAFYDKTAHFLKLCGIEEIESTNVGMPKFSSTKDIVTGIRA